MASVILLLVLWVVIGSAICWAFFRRRLLSGWLEPVLRYPILIIESDDWGVGPAEDSAALDTIAEMLSRYTDRHGRHPVMTLGIILGQPDRQRMKKGTGVYRRSTLDSDTYQPIREAITRGGESGVFDVQLHGMEHYWPDAVMKYAQNNVAVSAWLHDASNPPATELPDYLQSRWIDASTLPSVGFDQGSINVAVREEVNCFSECFGRPPTVAVPPTFVWTEAVEHAWAAMGIKTIVTPGRRNTGRDKEGRLTHDRELFFNGKQSADAVIYLVRNNYFEPALGHDKETGLDALCQNTRLGKPTLLESHRFNYIGDKAEGSLQILEGMLHQALGRLPDIVFLTTHELSEIYRRTDRRYIDTAYSRRVNICYKRVMQNSGTKKKVMVWLLLLPLMLILSPAIFFPSSRRRQGDA